MDLADVNMLVQKKIMESRKILHMLFEAAVCGSGSGRLFLLTLYYDCKFARFQTLNKTYGEE